MATDQKPAKRPELIASESPDIDLIDGLRCFQYAKNPAQPHCVLGDDTGFGAGI